MNPLLYKKGSSFSLSTLNLNEWHEQEKKRHSTFSKLAVDEEGCLLDNLTLELRVHPPEVNVDNALSDKGTVVTIDSANRPGSLVYVSKVASIC